nr:membrane protein insertion efficiency factor YidD [Candidatus Omnitrophota bacterium]
MFSRKSFSAVLKNSIIFYHNNISSLMLCQCRFYPSCSQYTLLAIEDKGIFLGLLKGLQRIMRCNPFSQGGYDPYKSN